MLPSLASSQLRINFVVNPPQEDLALHYRGHDVFVFSSWYEAWGMRVLEAMASGLAVVTTKCYGVNHFAIHGVNCLMASPGDFVGGRGGGGGGNGGVG